jgi:hypothetical protein
VAGAGARVTHRWLPVGGGLLALRGFDLGRTVVGREVQPAQEVPRMATRAEWFRYNTERSGPKKPKTTLRQPRDGKTETHNESDRAAKHAAYALEAAPGARPSRLSTRKSANRLKTDAQSRIKQRTMESRQGERPRAERR